MFKYISTISAAEVDRKIRSAGPLVLDCRSEQAYAGERIEGAFLVSGNRFDQAIEGMDRNREVICYCYKGISSLLFCKQARQAGFKKVYNLRGGYSGWKNYQRKNGIKGL